LLKKNGTFESRPKILIGETAEKIFKIGYGCGEMTLFVIHGRKILGTNPEERFRELSQSSRRVLGDFWESSRRALGKLSQGSRRLLGDFWESSRRALGQLSESSGRLLGDFWESSRRALGEF